ncbi:hypothetical protein ID144_14610 [Pseudomonas sp. JM0905a]|uniref:hypothetical protein n=1 Tax=Pseudomonas sp. JM0905a TaxID=2772484 RepID=UPI0016830731|nr:hypothetical protein [Pseudomonas sp. JM0905a]MBD2838278.1 hypothetical protein [Pseudomonas sp. JM0905a]
MEPIIKEHELMVVLRHVMSHGLITLLAVAIAFTAPDVARFILFEWWPRVELDSNLLLATEIGLASTLMLLFTLGKSAWDSRHRMASAREAALLFARTPGKKGTWLSGLQERSLLRSLPTARDASVLSLTGYETLTSPNSLLKDVINHAYEIRVMLLNPCSEAARRRLATLPGACTVASFQRELSASIEFLKSCRKRGKKVTLKFYDQDPFWKVVVLDDRVWVQHCHSGREIREQPEYVFGRHHADPSQGLFVPFFTYFLQKWNEPDHWEYDFDTAELVKRNATTGIETDRIRLELQAKDSETPTPKVPGSSSAALIHAPVKLFGTRVGPDVGRPAWNASMNKQAGG